MGGDFRESLSTYDDSELFFDTMILKNRRHRAGFLPNEGRIFLDVKTCQAFCWPDLRRKRGSDLQAMLGRKAGLSYFAMQRGMATFVCRGFPMTGELMAFPAGEYRF